MVGAMIVGMVKPTTRKRERRAPTPIATGLSLVALTQQTDALIGAPSGLDEHLSGYRVSRDLSVALAACERREAIERACVAALARGVDNDGRWRIQRVDVSDRSARRLTSGAVRRCQPDLWEASRVKGYRLTVSATDRPPLRLTPIRAGTVSDLIASMRLDVRRAADAQSAADDHRAALIGVYQAIESARPWGGDPMATTDGWVIGYQCIDRFSATRARELAEAQSIDVEPMMATVMISGGVRWRVVDHQGDAESVG